MAESNKGLVLFLVFSALFDTKCWLTGVGGCPANECICDKDEILIDCAEFELDSVPYFEAENRTYSTLTLSNNKLSRLPADAFINLKVAYIEIKRNRRKELKLHSKAFRGTEDWLHEVYIFRSKVRFIPRGLFRGLRHLTSIVLEDNTIDMIEPGAFKGASNVRELNLAWNRLQTLDAKVFVGLKKLEQLLLYKNDISVVDSRAFGPLHSLQELELQENKIRDLQPRVFKSLNKLKYLDLRYNAIPALFPLMFRGLPSLEILNMRGNNLMMIAKDTFSSMSNLTSLDLSKCKLTYVESDVFRGLGKLRNLKLYSNALTELQDGLFRHLPGLKLLNVDSNRLTTINACAFVNYMNLKQIQTVRNLIHCDCMLKWTTADAAPDVQGGCATPDIYEGDAIRKQDKYKVCINQTPDCSYRHKQKRYKRRKYKL